MDAVAYRSLRELQDEHWWFVGRRKIVAQLIRRLVKLPPQATILEAGCGYGGNLEMLRQFGELDAFECEGEARAHASTLNTRGVRYGFLPDNLGFEGKSFDLVAMLDVLEHIDDDLGSLRSLRARLTRHGALMLTVPALPWLWSEHDELHHHKRRYTKGGLERLLDESDFELVDIGYFNTLLFPLALIQRLVMRLTGRQHRVDEMPSPILNRILGKIFTAEQWLAGRIPLPIGLSLYAVARPNRR